MSRRHLTMLLALAAIWGSSFMLIEIALRDLDPATLILLRLGSAALALAVYVPLAGLSFAPLRPYFWPLAFMGLFNTALPFYLISWGQQYIDSGLAAILNASAPLFTALLAVAVDQAQRVTGMRLAGVILGFGGIVALVGFEPEGGDRAVLGSLAVVAGAACYAIGALYAGRRFAGMSPLLVSVGTLLWATALTLPPGIATASSIGWETLLAVLFLGVAATAVGYLLYFGLIAGAGASRAILVTYLVPSMALVYGAVFLDEKVSALALVGLALVLTGVALGTPTLTRQRTRREPVRHAAVYARRRVGGVVPLHQGRHRGHRAGADDGRADAPGRGGAARLPRLADESEDGVGRPPRRMAPLPRARPPERGGALLADRMGREVHRLRPRGRRPGLGADLQRAIILRVLPHERLNGTRMAGLAVGIVGVAVVTGVHPDGGWWAIAGALAVVGSSLSYAGAGVYGQLAVSGTPGPVLAAGSMLVGGLVLLPLALFQLPQSVPSWEAVSSVSHSRCSAPPSPSSSSSGRSRCTVGSPVARDVPHSRLCPPVRRRLPRRGDLARDPRRARADPRRRHARLGTGAAAGPVALSAR